MARAGTDRHPQDGGAAARLGRRATLAWVAALSLVAVLVLAGGLWLGRLDAGGQRAAAAVADAMAQRQRLKRIAAYLPELAGPEDPAAGLAELEDAVRRMREARLRLTDGPDAPVRRTAELRAHYLDGAGPADGALAAFLDRLEPVLAGARAGETPAAETIAALRAEVLGPLLAASERGVTLLEAHRTELAEHADRMHGIVLGAILFTILAEGLFLFRPLTRRLVAQAGELERLARHDATTGLLSRGAFLAALDRELAARRPLAVVVIDLDHFKEVNDAEGHAAGDAVLRAAAARIREVVRAADPVGRLGGDELACLLPETAGARPLETVLARLRAALHEPVPFRDRALRTGATIGVARYPDDASGAERLLRAADEALMRAKRAQRGSVGRASAEDAPRIERLATVLRAVDADDPELPGLAAALQPVVALAPDPLDPAAVLGFEALARWAHPSLGRLVPEELFPAAAASGRAARLGRAVRRRALAAFLGLGREAVEGRYLAVNLSPAEVMHADLLAELEADLAEHGLPWRALCLEITEQILLDRVSDERLAQLVRLRERGVRLALDDFGTGTSGLAQLLRLPIDILKIDRRFVGAITRDDKAKEIVRATLGLAVGLELEVIAEGIEEPAQAALLAQLGCRAGQGWLIGRPLQGEELAAFWRVRTRPPANVVPMRA